MDRPWWCRVSMGSDLIDATRYGNPCRENTRLVIADALIDV